MRLIDSEKLKCIIRPFLWIGMSCIIGYSMLHIILLHIYTVLPFREDLFRLAYPMLAPIIPILIWLRPGLKRLHFPPRQNNVWGYGFLAVVCISVPTTILQAYIPQVFSRSVHLHNISGIAEQPSARYYTVDTLFVATLTINEDFLSQVTGKYNNRLEFHHYIVAPAYAGDQSVISSIRANNSDTSATLITPGRYTTGQLQEWLSQHPPVAWIGWHNEESIRNDALPIDKQNQWRAFQDSSIALSQQAPWKNARHWERMKNDVHRKRILSLIPPEFRTQPIQLLSPRDTPLRPRHSYYLCWTLVSYSLGLLAFIGLVRLRPLKEEA